MRTKRKSSVNINAEDWSESTRLPAIDDDEWTNNQGVSSIHTIQPVGVLLNPDNAHAMQSVWRAIFKRCDDEEEAKEWFLLECVSAYYWDERQTTAEKRDELLAISRKARELAEMVGPNHSSCAWRLSIDTMHESTGANLSSGETFPFMNLLLVDFAKRLEVEAKIPPEVKKPSAKNAHEAFFVRRLTTAMRERFNQPLVATVATTASVVFGKKITEQFVRNNTRP